MGEQDDSKRQNDRRARWTLTNALLTILALCFMAWAGVVWNATGVVRDQLASMRDDFKDAITESKLERAALQSGVEAVAKDISTLEKTMLGYPPRWLVDKVSSMHKEQNRFERELSELRKRKWTNNID